MFYKIQIIKYFKKNYFENQKILLNVNLKFSEKKKYLLLICEDIKLTLLDLIIKKDEENKRIFLNIFIFINKIIINTNYIKNYLFYLFYIKYKNIHLKTRKIFIYFEIDRIIELKDELFLSSLKYMNKKNKKYVDYNEKKIRFKFLYLYLNDYFISINFILKLIQEVKKIEMIVIYFIFLLKNILNLILKLNLQILNEYIKSIK